MTDLITAEEAQKLLDRADGADTSGAVARSIEAFSHAAPRLARTVIALHAELAQTRADAKAAVAVVVEKAAEAYRKNAETFETGIDVAIRALAPEDAIAEAREVVLADLLGRGAMYVSLSMREWHTAVAVALAQPSTEGQE